MLRLLYKVACTRHQSIAQRVCRQMRSEKRHRISKQLENRCDTMRLQQSRHAYSQSMPNKCEPLAAVDMSVGRFVSFTPPPLLFTIQSTTSRTHLSASPCDTLYSKRRSSICAQNTEAGPIAQCICMAPAGKVHTYWESPAWGPQNCQLTMLHWFSQPAAACNPRLNRRLHGSQLLNSLQLHKHHHNTTTHHSMPHAMTGNRVQRAR